MRGAAPMSAVELIEQALAAAAAWEPSLHAFAHLDPGLARERAARRPRGGPLDGVPLAVKDIFDTAGEPTEYGSPLFVGRVPAASATAVDRLERAGAVVVGKTVTAELAYFAPGPTTNPWSTAHTPGGSSMGSAAAVAAGIVPLALGSQTNGSIIRPAAFCGAVGMKPSQDRLPGAGALCFSSSLDQVGVFATSVASAALACAVLADERLDDWWSGPSARPPRLGVVRAPEWDEASPATRRAFDQALARIRAGGGELVEQKMRRGLAEALPVHRTIMAFEAARDLAPLVHARGRAGAALEGLFEEGSAIAEPAYRAALERQARERWAFDGWIASVDAVITPAVLGEAPDLESTGDPRCCTRWSLVGAPAVALPNGRGPAGLPLAIQLVGRRGGDQELGAVAAWVEGVLPSIGLSTPPGPRHRDSKKVGETVGSPKFASQSQIPDGY